MFTYKKRVAFYETDTMGVVHHSNYIRYYEEARVDWLRGKGLIGLHSPRGPVAFAVVDVQCKYLSPAKFDEEIEVRLEAQQKGIRLIFRYACYNTQRILATGETTLVALNADLQLDRLPQVLTDILQKESWSEEWPPAKIVASDA